MAGALAAEAAGEIEAGSAPEAIGKTAGDWCSDLDRVIEQHMRRHIARGFP